MFKTSSTLANFFGFAGALFAVLAVTIILVSNSVIRQSFLERVKNSTSRNIQMAAQSLLTPQDFSFTGSANFDDLFRNIKTAEVIRIKVWDGEARVIFSDDKSIVGQSFTDNEEFQHAIQGEVVTELQTPVKTENISEQGYKQLVEVYVPINFAGNPRPAGVIEVYFKLDNVNDQIGETQQILVLTTLSFILVSFVLLYVLFKLVVLKQTDFLRQVIDTDPNLVFVKDWTGKFTLVNKATADIYNTTVEALIGKTDADFNKNAEEVKSFLAADRLVMQSLQPDYIKEEPVTDSKTGEQRWFETTKVPISYGGAKQVLGISKDVTLRKKNDEQVRLQAAAIHAAAHGIVITDTNAIIQYINPAFTKMTGYTPQEAIGQSTRLLNSGKQDKSFYKQLWDTVLSGAVWHGEVINRRKDGSLYTEEQSITPVKNDSGKITHFIAIKQDVSERKQTEETLEKTKKAILNVLEDLTAEKAKTEAEKAKDEAILANIGDGLIITNDKGIILQVNRTFEALLGWKAEEVIGKNMFEMVPKVDEKGDSVPLAQRSLHNVLSGKLKVARVSSVSKTHSYIRKDKSPLPITGVATPIILHDKIVGAVQVFRDASVEARIDKAKTEFVSLASHELRTPLTAIDGLVSMMLDGEYGPIGKDFKQPLADISTSSERMIHLVNDLLNLSRIQTGKLKYVLSEFPVASVISETLKLLQPIAKLKGLKLAASGLDNTVIQADKDKVKQILDNLIGNSLKFTDKGSISVTAKVEGDKLEIRVTDTGIGIKKPDQQKLFGKFEQLSSTDGRPAGTGLGLYISLEMARQMGGDVWLVNSEPGKGSVFALSVPLSKKVVQ